MRGLKIGELVRGGVGLGSIGDVMGGRKWMSVDEGEGGVGVLRMVLRGVCGSVMGGVLMRWLYG